MGTIGLSHSCLQWRLVIKASIVRLQTLRDGEVRKAGLYCCLSGDLRSASGLYMLGERALDLWEKKNIITTTNPAGRPIESFRPYVNIQTIGASSVVLIL